MASTGLLICYETDPARVREVVESHLCSHRLLQGVQRLGLAVSGGADSVALFHLLLPLCRSAGIQVTVVHLNHGMRPEADGDARFACRLAEQAGLPILYEKVSVSEQRLSGQSPEMAAREARMAFFARCCEAAGLDAVATGHQADDVAEGVLLRLARGAGAAGLSGLRPITRRLQPIAAAAAAVRLTLIRPLLPIAGAALRDWLRQNSHSWCEDASNRDPTIPRNRVRLDVLPYLEAMWITDLRARLCHSAEALREDDALLDALATRQLDAMTAHAQNESADGDHMLDIAALRQHAPALQRRILRHWLFRQSVPEAAGLETTLAVLAKCHEQADWKYQLPGNALLLCHAGRLSILQPNTQPPPPTVITDGVDLVWGHLTIRADQGTGVSSTDQAIGVYPACCSLDLERLKGKQLRVRTRQPGDRIAPTGLEGSKKIQDLLVDAKVPEHQRDHIPVFECDDDVVWIPGYRISRHYALPTPDAPCLRITVRSTHENATPNTVHNPS